MLSVKSAKNLYTPNSDELTGTANRVSSEGHQLCSWFFKDAGAPQPFRVSPGTLPRFGWRVGLWKAKPFPTPFFTVAPIGWKACRWATAI